MNRELLGLAATQADPYAFFLGYPMPNTGRPLPLKCPECQHEGATLIVKSLSVITAECAKCTRAWAMALDSLPVNIQAKVLEITAHDPHNPSGLNSHR